MRLRFTVWLAKPHRIETGAKRHRLGLESVSPIQSPTQSPTQSDSPIEQLLLALDAGPLSSGELRSHLKLKHRPTFRENYLHPALAEGYIEMTIPEKPNSRLQKYRLSEKGRLALEG